MSKSTLSFRVPISVEAYLKATEEHDGMSLLVFATIITCGGIDYVIGRQLIVFYSRDYEQLFRAELPSSLGGVAKRRVGRKNVKLLKQEIARRLGGSFLRELRSCIERIENE